MLLRISVPDDNQRGPRYMRQLLDSLHQADRRRSPITLHFARYDQTVGLFCRVPSELRAHFENDLPSLYNGCTVAALDKSDITPSPRHCIWSMQLRLEPDVFSLTDKDAFEDNLQRDFVDPLTGILSRLGNSLFARVDLTIKPASLRRCRHARRVVDTLACPFCRSRPELRHWFAVGLTHHGRFFRSLCNLVRWFIALFPKTINLAEGSDKVRGHHLFEATLRIVVAGPADRRKEAYQCLQGIAGAYGVFSRPQQTTWKLGPCKRCDP